MSNTIDVTKVVTKVTYNGAEVPLPDVEAAKEIGRQEEYDRIVDPAKIIERTITGSAITANDVSEIPHKCAILAETDTVVKVTGKNLLDIENAAVYHQNPYFQIMECVLTDTGVRMTSVEDLSGHWKRVGIKIGSVEEFAGKTISVSCGEYKSSVSSSKHVPHISICYTDVEPCSDNGNIVYDNGGYLSGDRYKEIAGSGQGASNVSCIITGDEPGKYIFAGFLFCYGGAVAVGDWVEYNNIQIEIGGSATAYEPYKGSVTYTIEAGQTIEIDSICPSMTLLADNNATLTFDYHKSFGSQSEYDRFWDVFQINGTRTGYNYGFGGAGWAAETFRPKYNITAESAVGMFYQFAASAPASLKQILANQGITLTFPKCMNINDLFSNSGVTEIGELDFSTITRLNCTQIFISCTKLKSIDRIVPPDGQSTFQNWFYNCPALENVTFEGTINANGLNMQWSTKLSKASIVSIIGALSPTTSGLSITLSEAAVITAFGSTDATEWTELIGEKSNWTINLL